MMMKKYKPNIILAYLFAISLIYQSGSVMSAVVGDGIIFQITRVLLIIIPIVCVIFSKKLNRYLPVLLLAVMVSLILIMINYLLWPDGVLQLMYKIVILILSMILFMYFNDKCIDLREYIYKVIIALAIVSLLIYVPTEILKLPIPYSMIYEGNSYRYRNYFELFFTYHYKMNLPRLSGLFWEPGCYQIYLNLALFYYIFENKKKKSQLILLIISIFLTQSTTGYCLASFLLAIYISRSPLLTKNSQKISAVLGLVFATAIAVVVVSNKIGATGGIAGSYTLRMADILNGWSVFVKNPIFGTGFANENQFISLDIFGRGSSNGLISYLYMTGVVGITIALLPFFVNLKKARNKPKQLLWVMLFVVFNATEPIYNLPIAAFYLGVEYVIAMRKIRVENEI